MPEIDPELNELEPPPAPRVQTAEIHVVNVPEDVEPQRVDRFLAAALPQYSRARIIDLFEDGHVSVNDCPWKPARKLRGGERISVTVPQITCIVEPVPMEIEVLHEDEWLAVVNKRAGIIVHPGAATRGTTLVHGLLHRFPQIATMSEKERPGIVHRLDKDTSGCLIVALNEIARGRLVGMFAQRRIHKEYYALVRGVPREDTFSIECNIGRSVHDRKKMSVHTQFGREAITHATADRVFGAVACALAVRIETGRTHQIRVHLAHAGHPVLGDMIYGQAAKQLSFEVGAMRQMLHAHKLSFRHPMTRQELVVVSPLPPDIIAVERELAARYP